MDEIKEIKKFTNKINSQVFDSKEYQKMKIEELSIEIKETVKFQQELFQIIEEFEMREIQEDFIKYAKMIYKNTTERKILKIQETHLKKN